MIPPALGFAVFLASFVVARILHERALRRLSTEEKGRMVEAFSSHRLVALVPIAGMAAVYFGMTNLGLSLTAFLGVYIPAVLVFAAVSHVLVFRKLRELETDPAFIREYGISRAITLVGFAMLLLTL